MRQEEHNEQVRLFGWARREEERRPELRLLFAVPNGGRRDAVTGARLKEEGVKAGVPDVVLPVARGGWHGLFVEMKAGKGRPSPAQVGWLKALGEEGFLTRMCYGSGEAVEVIEGYLDGKYQRSDE